MADISNKDLLAAQKESNQTLLKINESLRQQLDGVQDAIKAPPKKNIEEVKEKKAENKKFLDALKGIVSAGAGGVKSVGKDVAKTTGGFLAKFLKFGLAAVMLPLLALIGGVAGIFKSITSTKEFTFLSSKEPAIAICNLSVLIS